MDITQTQKIKDLLSKLPPEVQTEVTALILTVWPGIEKEFDQWLSGIFQSPDFSTQTFEQSLAGLIVLNADANADHAATMELKAKSARIVEQIILTLLMIRLG